MPKARTSPAIEAQDVFPWGGLPVTAQCLAVTSGHQPTLAGAVMELTAVEIAAVSGVQVSNDR